MGYWISSVDRALWDIAVGRKTQLQTKTTESAEVELTEYPNGIL